MTEEPLSSQQKSRVRLVEIALFVVLVLIAMVLTVTFFNYLPIERTWLGIDWHYFWQAIENGQVNYNTGENGLRIVPWSLPAILPLGFVSFRSSWGVLTLITLGVLIASVPPARKRWQFWLSVLLVISAFPAMRHIADGNLEWMTIAGILLILYSSRTRSVVLMALGILLATAKPQITWLFAIGLGLYLLSNWPLRHWLYTALIMLAEIIPLMLWQGRPWIDALDRMSQRGSLADMSLLAAINRLGLSSWLWALAALLILGLTFYLCLADRKTFSRQKAAMLLAASLLLAPYASSISYLTVFAIGVSPLICSRPRVGLLLVILSDIPYLIPQDFMILYGAYISTAMLFLCWCVFVWQVAAERRQSSVAAAPVTAPA